MQPTPEYITLKEVLATIAGQDAFSIAFITCNKSTGGGGQWRRYDHCTGAHVTYRISDTAPKPTQAEVVHMIKHPNHFENSTRNIKLADGQIKKVHIRLIRKFNGRVVL